MDITLIKPPRKFPVGVTGGITIKDCARIRLEPDEQVTLTTENGGEYDVVRKDWGFYATPSLNGRLLEFGLRGCLVRNKISRRVFVMLVEEGQEPIFDSYLINENLEVMSWLCDE